MHAVLQSGVAAFTADVCCIPGNRFAGMAGNIGAIASRESGSAEQRCLGYVIGTGEVLVEPVVPCPASLCGSSIAIEGADSDLGLGYDLRIGELDVDLTVYVECCVGDQADRVFQVAGRVTGNTGSVFVISRCRNRLVVANIAVDCRGAAVGPVSCVNRAPGGSRLWQFAFGSAEDVGVMDANNVSSVG